MRELFEAHAAEVDSIIDCELDAIAVARACLADVVACDPAYVVGCATSAYADVAVCGAYPESVEAGIDECCR